VTASRTGSRRLEKELLARNLVPDGCRFIALVVEVNAAVVIKLEKYVTTDDMIHLAAALKAAAEAQALEDAS
jgi:hypothetical protein